MRDLLVPCCASLLLASAPVLAQEGRYTTFSFESPGYQLGTLAGPDLWSGQDGWILLGGDPASAQVQSQVVRSGAQAVAWDAAKVNAAGGFAELRRNALFNVPSDSVLEIEMDFQITSASVPTSAWILIMQVSPIPCSEHVRWLVEPDGEIWFRDGQNCSGGTTWNTTGIKIAHDNWHHTRTIIDVPQNRTELWIDGVLIASGAPNALSPQAAHGFTQWFCDQPGNDTLYLDNFQVRPRKRQSLALSVDLERVQSGARALVDLRLGAGRAHASRNYLLLGSMSGTNPGISLGGGVTMPLQPDPFLFLVAGSLNSPLFQRFQGQLGPDGSATATFDSVVALPAALAGRTMHFAYVPFWPFDAASEAAAVHIR